MPAPDSSFTDSSFIASSIIGSSPYRKEDARLLTGQGRFVEDRLTPDTMHMAILRSPHPHAILAEIDLGAAPTFPGVSLVLTGADLKDAGVKPLPCATPQESFDGTPFHHPPRHALAIDKVRFVGDPVVAVVAETLEQAVDAIEQVTVSYDEIDFEINTAKATENAYEMRIGDAAGVEEAFATASHRVTVRGVINNRVIVNPIETRGYIGSYDPENGSYTLLTGSQGVHMLRRWVAETLDIPPEQMRVVTEDVGGSFATKLMAYPEQTLVLHAAKCVGRPVAWISSRNEALLTDAHARDHVSEAEAAFDAEGRFQALRVKTKASLGAYASSVAPGISGPGFAKVLGHNYRIPAIETHATVCYTNTAPTDAYRGAGKPEAIYLVERLLEKASFVLGIDRTELRCRNFVPSSAMPHQHGNGLIYDSGDFESALNAALEIADVAGFEARRAASETNGKARGIGICPSFHATGGFPSEESRLSLTKEGRVEVRTGVQASGQGHETALAQIAAHRLQIPIDQIDVIEGDTDKLHTSGGTGGSSSLPIGATTIDRAAVALIEDGKEKAGAILEASAADLDYGDGAFTVVGTDRKITLFELAQTLESQDAPGCVGGADFEGQAQTIPYSGQVCEVEVDRETGFVTIERYTSADDIGVRLNPKIAEGQIHGGIAQGIGQAWLENTVYDPDSGQLLSGSFMDYGLPRADDLPFFTLAEVDVPTEANHLGMKGVGELGTNGGLAPFVLAVYDALGVTDPEGLDLEMPLTPEKVWRAVRRGD